MLKAMNESRVKRLWKNRLSSLGSCIHSSHTSVEEEEEGRQSIQELKKLPAVRRKPLPADCPAFDFDICEKTYTDIPVRCESKQYQERISDIDHHLEKIRNDEKIVLLTKLLQEKSSRNQ
jgi:hypothetical protein